MNREQLARVLGMHGQSSGRCLCGTWDGQGSYEMHLLDVLMPPPEPEPPPNARAETLAILLSYWCSTCDAAPGKPCITRAGLDAPVPHGARAEVVGHCARCDRLMHADWPELTCPRCSALRHR